MGYSYYILPDGREAGYGVEAICDFPECTTEIDRGLGFLCGRDPDGHRDPEEPGCGKYFCGVHDFFETHHCTNTKYCPNCGGEGSQPVPHDEPCSACDGRGIVAMDFDPEEEP